MPNAYLAVDFFFILSGFVIDHGYGEKLRGSLRLRSFLRLRLIRLYPLYALGLLLGVAVYLAGLPFGVLAGSGRAAVLMSAVLNPFFIPAPVSPSEAFLLNGPAWSLSIEIVVNLVFGAIALRLSMRNLVVAWAVFAVVLVLALLRSGPGGDMFDSYFTSGIPRGLFGFFTGVLLHRLHVRGSIPIPPGIGLPGAAAVLAIVLSWQPAANPAYAYVMAICVILPSAVWIGASTTSPKWLRPTLAYLGEVSYPLYITHVAVISAAILIANVVGASEGPITVIWILGVCATAVALATALIAPDKAVRSRLSLIGKRGLAQTA